MENNLKMFNSDKFGEIRTVNVEGKIYFVASDIAKALGYARPNDAISAHCRYTIKHRIPHPQSKNKTLDVNVIPEGDIYRLVAHSKLPSAQGFESWIFDEVIPSLRRTGKYSTKPEQQSLLACLEDLIIQQATLLKELFQNKNLLTSCLP